MPMWLQFMLTGGGSGFIAGIIAWLNGQQKLRNNQQEISSQFHKDLLLEMGSLRQRCKSLEDRNDVLEAHVSNSRIRAHAWQSMARVMKLQILDLMCDFNELLTSTGKSGRFDMKAEELKLTSALAELDIVGKELV